MNIAEVDLLLNYGCVCYVVMAPFAVHWGTTPQGLKRLMQLAAWLQAAAVLLRLVPEISWWRDSLFPHARLFVHAAQCINAFACPPISVTVTKLSVVWFPDTERTRVTAIGQADVQRVQNGEACNMMLICGCGALSSCRARSSFDEQ